MQQQTEQAAPTVSSDKLSSYLFSTKENAENYNNLKDNFGSNATIKPIPLSYSFEYSQNMEYQTKVLLELIRLHKEKKINLNKSVRYVSDFTAYGSPLEVHFGLFHHIAEYFAQDPKLVNELIANIDIFGGVLLHEIDFTNNSVNDNIRTTALYDPRTQEIVMNSLKGSAKYCQYFNVYGTHVIVFCRLYDRTEFLGHYPFLLRIRDPATGELVKGVEMKWLGPSLGHRGGREHYITFDNVRIPLKQHLLNKFLHHDSRGISVSTVETKLQLLFQTALTQQKLHDSHRAVRELAKAVFLVTKYTNMRTQFKTLAEKGQERKIFDYQYNRMRILKSLINTIVYQVGLNTIQEKLDSLVGSPENNSEELIEFTYLINALYPFLYERAAEGVESLREGTGGMGYLKFSGIPTPHENIINGSVAACPGKEEKYVELALFLLNGDFKSKSRFMNFVAANLDEKADLPEFKEDKDYANLQNYLTLHKFKIIQRRASLLNLKSNKSLILSHESLKDNKLAYDEATKLGKDFVEYIISSLSHSVLTKTLQKENSILNPLFQNFLLQNFLDDIKPIIENPANVAEDFYSRIKDIHAINTDLIGEIAEKLTTSYQFDAKMLNSVFESTADETYEKLLDLCKNQNLRNDPKIHAEIRKDLIEYLNRPKPSL